MAENFEIIKHLVLVDDDTDDQMFVKELIEEFSPKIRITCIGDGKQLMDWLHKEESPDLILLDLNMPFKTGVQCLNEIRVDKKLKSLPVVILTTSRNKSDIDLCYKSGAQLFYSKPWSIDDSRALIHSILNIDWKTFKDPLNPEEFMKIALEGRTIRS